MARIVDMCNAREDDIGSMINSAGRSEASRAPSRGMG